MNAPPLDPWFVFRSDGKVDPAAISSMKPPPQWRTFYGVPRERAGIPEARAMQRLVLPLDALRIINAALLLRRPLLVTGEPGTGKSSLARAIAYELGLGRALEWHVNSRTTLASGLYRYDAIGRLTHRSKDPTKTPNRGRFVYLGPLGTALLPSRRPRVLLIDEIDKGDPDLPNELLHVFEDGWFSIPELGGARRIASQDTHKTSRETQSKTYHVYPYDGTDRVPVTDARVECHAFPIIVMTSNGERDFPPAFLRRCLRLELKSLESADELTTIVKDRLKGTQKIQSVLDRYSKSREQNLPVATDQLLSAAYLATHYDAAIAHEEVLNAVFRPLT